MAQPRVFFIYPSQFYCPEAGGYGDVRLFFCCLQGALEGLAECRIFDLERMLGRPRDKMQVSHFERRLRAVLAALETPRVVALSCYTSYNYLSTVAVARIARATWPDAILVVGGYHATSCPEDFLEHKGLFDYVVQGEGELALRCIATEGHRRSGVSEIVTSPVLPPRDWPLIDLERYGSRTDSMAVALSRGCHRSCAFCCESTGASAGWRGYGVSEALSIVRQLNRAYRFREIKFADAHFGKNRTWLREFLRGLRDLGDQPFYWMECRADLLENDLLDLIATMNITLYLGVETFSPAMVSVMAKARNGDEYVRRSRQLISACNERDIPVEVGLIANHPGETCRTLRETFEAVSEIVASRDAQSCTFHLSPFRLYPGNVTYQRIGQFRDTCGAWIENDGWWRMEGGDLKRGAERLIASADLLEAHGYDPYFWRAEWARTIAPLGAKYSRRAYAIRTYIDHARLAERAGLDQVGDVEFLREALGRLDRAVLYVLRWIERLDALDGERIRMLKRQVGGLKRVAVLGLLNHLRTEPRALMADLRQRQAIEAAFVEGLSTALADEPGNLPKLQVAPEMFTSGPESAQ